MRIDARIRILICSFAIVASGGISVAQRPGAEANTLRLAPRSPDEASPTPEAPSELRLTTPQRRTAVPPPPPLPLSPVESASFRQEQLPPPQPSAQIQLPPLPTMSPRPEELSAVAPLALDEVVLSVQRWYPLLAAVQQDRAIAAGEVLSANGAWDLKLQASGQTAPLGFYQNYRYTAGVEQPLWMGGKVTAGYRLGDGSFPVWYGERETNEGGEFAAGYQQPLLQDRAIDKRRAELQKAALKRQQADPKIRAQYLDFVRAASKAYWSWVAAGQAVEVARELLRIAEDRQSALEGRVQRGDLKEIDLTDNRRLIVQRQARFVIAERKLQQAAIELSLFVRDGGGAPLLADNRRLPSQFPQARPPDEVRFPNDLQLALVQNPDLRRIRLQQRQAEIDLAYARNLRLPALDAYAYNSKDVGGQASTKGDKTPYELEAGLLFNMPLQRRDGAGKIESSAALLTQLRAQERFLQDRVAANVQDAISALRAAYEQIGQARESYELALKMEIAEERAQEIGSSNLFVVNIREQQAFEAAIVLVESGAEYFRAIADYRAAVAVDPQQPLPGEPSPR